MTKLRQQQPSKYQLLRTENERLRHDLTNPPADIQELVIKKLGLVSGEALAKAEAEIERLNDLLKTHKVLENFKSYEKCAKDLAHHKQLLVEARRALEFFGGKSIVGPHYHETLAHINQALGETKTT